MKSTLIQLHWLIFRQFGLDPQGFLRSLRGVRAIGRDRAGFRRGYAGKIKLMACLRDRYAEGGTNKSEYFWQDLLMARTIHEASQIKHVDIGSRVYGFVAHVVSVRECQVFDLRPINTMVPSVVSRKADLETPASLSTTDGGYCDSLSCLQAIEHLRLGRYGDPINTLGYQRSIANVAQLLQPSGKYYLSIPIGE